MNQPPTPPPEQPEPSASEAGSAIYYVEQMLSELKRHGIYRVKWEWAISDLKEGTTELAQARAALAQSEERADERDEERMAISRAAIESLQAKLAQCEEKLAGCYAKIEETKAILRAGLDRDFDPADTLHTLATVAVNGLYWSGQEISRLTAAHAKAVEDSKHIMRLADEDDWISQRIHQIASAALTPPASPEGAQP